MSGDDFRKEAGATFQGQVSFQLVNDPAEVDATQWDALLAIQDRPTPFFSHAYLAAMHESHSAVPDTGWQMRWLQCKDAHGQLQAATCFSIKTHSYGEYVFDWAWARAYQEHGMAYYPKAVLASPFTPVPGSRLLARTPALRQALLQALLQVCGEQGLSSLHLLFASDDDLAACTEAGLMPRHTVQFHWSNPGFADHDAFLASLAQPKRKKIRAEMRKVADAGVHWRVAEGSAISAADWAFFDRCYERTYLEHGNPRYLTPAFFAAMRDTLAHAWVLFTAERDGLPIATSLIAIQAQKTATPSGMVQKIAYGRYWGALQRVDCLHFDACYHQPLKWCINNGVARYEGGAQGEHKLARGLMPVQASSAHWVAHPGFSEAVERFLNRESESIGQYLAELEAHSPFK